MASAFRAAGSLAIIFLHRARTRHPDKSRASESTSMRRKRYAVLRRPTPERVSGFSDGVFAVLITVLVFNPRPPELPRLAHFCCFGAQSYAVSYLCIAIVWTNHHYLMRYATEANLCLLWFSFAHVFSMSLLPLSTAWTANSELAPQQVPSMQRFTSS
jgi:uncharacterized membrane protein